jgi:hypothetical protein
MIFDSPMAQHGDKKWLLDGPLLGQMVSRKKNNINSGCVHRASFLRRLRELFLELCMEDRWVQYEKDGEELEVKVEKTSKEIVGL